MRPQEHWSARHSTLMRQRAIVLAILQRGVYDTPRAKSGPRPIRRPAPRRI
jgi:hypothetical protein